MEKQNRREMLAKRIDDINDNDKGGGGEEDAVIKMTLAGATEEGSGVTVSKSILTGHYTAKVK